jgi:hypothetical protein
VSGSRVSKMSAPLARTGAWAVLASPQSFFSSTVGQVQDESVVLFSGTTCLLLLRHL